MIYFRRKVLVIGVFLIIFALPGIGLSDESVLQRPAAKAFIQNMIDQHAFDEQALKKLFSQARLLPDVIARITRPAEGLPWHRYRQIFIKENRITQGYEFWQQQHEVLDKAAAKYGVPAEIIVAIIGVETLYGQRKGRFKILSSLSTLAFDYPKRSRFFTKELEHFLLLTREEKLDPLMLQGSYAGAMGFPQFIASSYRHYAIDFDQDGQRDLLNNVVDAIGSVANYLHKHGWVRDQPVTRQVSVTGGDFAKLIDKGLKPHSKLADFANFGVSVDETLAPESKASLIQLEASEGHQYWLGLNNFYVITRYNHSALYAMAVYQLAEKIRRIEQKNDWRQVSSVTF